MHYPDIIYPKALITLMTKQITTEPLAFPSSLDQIGVVRIKAEVLVAASKSDQGVLSAETQSACDVNGWEAELLWQLVELMRKELNRDDETILESLTEITKRLFAEKRSK